VSTLYASGILPAATPHFLGCIAAVEIFGRDFQLPDWWQLAPGGCRALSPAVVSGNYDFSSNTHCANPWPQMPASSIQAKYQGGVLRIVLSAQVSASVPLNATDEYYFFKLLISHAGTAGNGSCAGCASGVCFYLPDIEVFVPQGDASASIWHGLSNLAFWQGATYGAQCTTAARPTTWGAVKSLYR
jgi:hypothetical protein